MQENHQDARTSGHPAQNPNLKLVDTGRYFLLRRGCVLVPIKLLGLVAAMFGFALLTRSLWLPAVGHFLVIDAPVEDADAIIVLGGGWPRRAEKGALLYHQGYAPVVITTGGSYLPGDTYTAAYMAAQTLYQNGVPAGAVIQLDAPLSTYEEARDTGPMLETLGADKVLLVTDNFHMRRALMMFENALGDSVEVVPIAVEGPYFDPDSWWRDGRGLYAGVSEYGKLIYYLFGGQ